MALIAPINLVATPISSTRIDLTWVNQDEYEMIRIYRSGSTPVVEGDFYDFTRWSPEFWSDLACAAGTQYYYAIKGSIRIPPDISAFSNEDDATTPATLAAPTLVVATPISDIEIDLTFKDNSSDEKWHRVQRKLGAGGWDFVVDLEPNREFFRDGGLFLLESGYTDCVDSDIGKQVKDDGAEIGLLIAFDNARRRWVVDSGNTILDASAMTITAGTGAGTIARETTGLVKGSSYTYRVHAQQTGAESGAWVESAQVTTISEPSTPTLAAILDADTQDKSIRIRWTDVGSETGYRIEKDTVEIAVVGADITDFLATGLTPGVSYDFRVRAYNAAGNSGYSATRAKTTLTAYLPTAFEQWIRDPHIEPIYLAEVYAKMMLTGFTLESGVTWKKTISASDRGIDILEVFEDSVSYVEKTSIATVEATASTFWFDYDNRILYVHTSAGTDPANFLIEGAFWLYFSTHKDIEFTAEDQISPCDATTDWTGTALSIDTGDKKEGTGSLKDTVASPVVDTYYNTIYNPAGSWDWSAKEHILLWLKCDRANTAFTLARLRISDTLGNWRIWNLTFSAGEWTAVKKLLSTGDLESATPPDLALINYVRVRFGATDTTPFYKKIDNLRVASRLNHYLPLLAKEDIPDVTQEIKPYFEGSFSISSGSIAFMNAEIMGEHFFDKKFSSYTWINAKVIVKAGNDSFTYAQFREIFTLYIDSKSCSDTKITFQLRDVRKEMSQSIVLDKFNTTEYPGMVDEEGIGNKFIGKSKPIAFGFNELVVPIAIDLKNGKFQFNDTNTTIRSQRVDEVRRNRVVLIEDIHYYVDLQRSRVTFERDGRFVIDVTNKKIDFTEGGGGGLTATLIEGTYTTKELCDEIKDKLDTVGALTYTVGPLDIPALTLPKKFTIAATGEFALLWRTGTNGADGTATSVGITIGFDDDDDMEGDTSYEADADVITIQQGDIIEVTFHGFVNSANEEITNGAEIFKYLMNRYRELTDSELNLDSIYESKYANTNVLFIYIGNEVSFNEIIRSIEHSIEAYTFQDEQGRLGIKPQQTVVASNVKYIENFNIFSHSQGKDRSSLFWKVIVYYNKNSQDDSWQSKEAVDDTIDWKYRIKEPLEIYTYFRGTNSAQTLATSILNLLNKERINNTLSMLPFDVLAGDLTKFSRGRFYDSDGTASEITLRVIRISKSPASGKTSITAELS